MDGAWLGSGSETISDRQTGAVFAQGYPELIAAKLKTALSEARLASTLGPRPVFGSDRPHSQHPRQAEPTAAATRGLPSKPKNAKTAPLVAMLN